jgi:hypothetical protein
MNLDLGAHKGACNAHYSLWKGQHNQICARLIQRKFFFATEFKLSCSRNVTVFYVKKIQIAICKVQHNRMYND